MAAGAGYGLRLPDVTLCSAASVNVDATIAALTASLDGIEFGDCVLFTHRVPDRLDKRIRVELIERITSSAAYSQFMLRQFPSRIGTGHALVCQWDGFVLNPRCWTDDFLACDYIGAVWPQFSDGHSVGNGGFSLRSRKLLLACLDPRFRVEHPEDVAIGRLNRPLLEAEFDCVFADPALAARFSVERQDVGLTSFGFHGVFNLPRLLGEDRFLEVYHSLDERRPVWRDFWPLLRDLGSGPLGLSRRAAFATDRFKSLFVK